MSGLSALWCAILVSAALFGLSRLPVWWLRLGIAIEHIKPGHPQQNGQDASDPQAGSDQTIELQLSAATGPVR
jgi:hypothetical protein